MRKIFWLVIYFLFIPLILTANQSGVGFGLKAGANYSRVLVDYKKEWETGPEEFNWLFGFHVGGVLVLPLTENISFRPELCFSQQGSRWTVKLTEFIIDDPGDPMFSRDLRGKIKESVVLLPALINLRFGRSFSVEAGPQIGVLAYQKQSGDYLNAKSDRFRLSICLGANYEINQKYRVGLRYSFGLREKSMVFNEYNSLLQFGIEFKMSSR